MNYRIDIESDTHGSRPICILYVYSNNLMFNIDVRVNVIK